MYAGTSHNGVFIDNGRCLNYRICLAQKSCQVRAIVRIDRDEPPLLTCTAATAAGYAWPNAHITPSAIFKQKKEQNDDHKNCLSHR